MRDFLSSPLLLDFNITSKCNLACPFCYANSNNCKNNELSLDEILSTIDELDAINVQRVSLVGGEPFIHPDIFEIISYCEKKDFSLIINTNGTLLDEEKISYLQKYSFDGIMVSLDGPENIHDNIRGKDTYKKVVSNLQLLKKYSIPHASLLTLTNLNIDYLISTLILNAKLGIDNVGVMMLCPTGRAHSKHLIPPEKWNDVFIKLTHMIENNMLGINLKIIPINESEVFWEFYFPLESCNQISLLDDVWKMKIPKKSKRNISCSAGINTAAIDPEGNVFGCDLMISYPELSAGNIRDNSFLDIWNHSEVFGSLRNLSIENLEGPCRDCKYTWCGGGCRASAYALSGKNLKASDKNCHLVRDAQNELG